MHPILQPILERINANTYQTISSTNSRINYHRLTMSDNLCKALSDSCNPGTVPPWTTYSTAPNPCHALFVSVRYEYRQESLSFSACCFRPSPFSFRNSFTISGYFPAPPHKGHIHHFYDRFKSEQVSPALYTLFSITTIHESFIRSIKPS